MDNNEEIKIPIPGTYDVYWEPWVDAYKNEETEKLNKEINDVSFDDDDAFMEDVGNMAFSKPIKTIITPFGMLPLTEQSLASTHFKFWVGHSNFKLLEEFYQVIEDCEGVESVDILTPYRFRIAVGKLFKDRVVMFKVKSALLAEVSI